MNPSAPLVTVIVPCYNHQRYIEQCLQSILGQTYRNIELIVLDDGSKDDSPAIIKKLSEKHGFYFEHQKNMGLPRTLNKAAQMAKGEFLAICASDDYWHPEKLTLQVQAAKENPEAALFYGFAIEVDDDGKEYRRIGTPLNGHVFQRMARENPVPAPTAMFRRDAFFACGGFDPDCHIEDYLMWLKLARRYPICGLDKTLAYYRVTLNSASRNVKRMVEAEMQILEKMADAPEMKNCRANWIARSFNRLAPTQKRDALSLLFGNFELGILGQKTFWGGVLKLFLPQALLTPAQRLKRLA